MHECSEQCDKKEQPSNKQPQTEILELKTYNKLKNSVKSFKSKLSSSEERISDQEDRRLEITQSGEQREKRINESKESL